MEKWEKFSDEEVASWPAEHKRCRRCREVPPFSEFHKTKQCLFGHAGVCKGCRKDDSKRSYSNTTLEYRMWSSAKTRATKFGLPFTITLDDIVIPELCPVFGVPLVPKTKYAPSLDQRNPRGGYTPDNIVVISQRANLLKNNATADELTAVINWMNATIKV